LERNFPRLSDRSAAWGNGLPMGRGASSPWWSTMWRSCIEWRTSIVALSFSRGPTIRALDIRSGLNMEGTLEFLENMIDCAVDVCPSDRGDLRGFRPPRGHDPFSFRGECGLRPTQYLAVARLRLLPHLLAEI